MSTVQLLVGVVGFVAAVVYMPRIARWLDRISTDREIERWRRECYRVREEQARRREEEEQGNVREFRPRGAA